MPTRKTYQNPDQQIAAMGGTFLMIEGEDTNNFATQIAMGVHWIYVNKDIVITTLTEADDEGNSINVLEAGTAAALGQRISGRTLFAGTFLKAKTPGGFTRIATGTTADGDGNITCVRLMPVN